MNSKLIQALIFGAYAVLPIVSYATNAANEVSSQDMIKEKYFFVMGSKQTHDVKVIPYFVVGEAQEHVYVPLEVFSKFSTGDEFSDDSLDKSKKYIYEGNLQEFLEEAYPHDSRHEQYPFFMKDNGEIVNLDGQSI
ncbi:hypothetical protein ACQKEY_22730 [Lysinibacillus fusiformis]|uniref:hypothetical protein n=1 Tax=Lysinibacillus fusiformis TaxID=28031 RepID=UPI002E233B4D|nr:hypothetical protein [Lysinibacillus fusiformis]